jgi:hypothetical protein
MTQSATLALAAAAAVTFSQSLAAEPSRVPERLLVLQYVALGIDVGDRIVAAEGLIGDGWRASPREREALDEIRQRLEAWDRYVVVNRLAEAELLLVVRQGRKGGIGGGGGGGVSPGIGVQPPNGRGAQPANTGSAMPYAGAFPSGDDLLAVYDTNGSPSTPLWRMLASSGLRGRIPLFEAFRADVDRAAATRP